MSQKEERIPEFTGQISINISSTEGSDNLNETQTNSNKKDKDYSLYYTPMKKEKTKPQMPSTPKKEKKIINYEGLVGRNLTTIFEMM